MIQKIAQIKKKENLLIEKQKGQRRVYLRPIPAKPEGIKISIVLLDCKLKEDVYFTYLY